MTSFISCALLFVTNLRVLEVDKSKGHKMLIFSKLFSLTMFNNHRIPCAHNFVTHCMIEEIKRKKN